MVPGIILLNIAIILCTDHSMLSRHFKIKKSEIRDFALQWSEYNRVRNSILGLFENASDTTLEIKDMKRCLYQIWSHLLAFKKKDTNFSHPLSHCNMYNMGYVSAGSQWCSPSFKEAQMLFQER